MADELTKALLLEEVASEAAMAEALFVSVTSRVPLVQALLDTRAVDGEMLGRYLARSDAPFLRHVVPVPELVDRLPRGLAAQLLAIPVRRDAITGTIDVVVADATSAHAASEIAFHLGAPVRLVRAPLAAIEDALRRLRHRVSDRPGREEDMLYDSRPRSDSLRPPPSMPPAPRAASIPPQRGPSIPPIPPPPPLPARQQTLAPPASAPPPHDPNAYFDADALRARAADPRHAHVVPSAAPQAARAAGRGRDTRDTPPWGTPVHTANAGANAARDGGGAFVGGGGAGSGAPKSNLGSEIPIPLTRRTFTSTRGGTQRPPPLASPGSALGEGIPVDPGQLRNVVELNREDYTAGYRAPPPPAAGLSPAFPPAPAALSFIPGPPPLPDARVHGQGGQGGRGTYAAYAPQLPFADVGGVLAALRAAGSRDEVLELVLTGGRMVAFKVALFVVKRGGYLGWACTPEFGDRAALQSILIPLDAQTTFDEAAREGLYLGPLPHDALHSALHHIMRGAGGARGASRDVAVVPIRVSGKTAVMLVADELGDTMLATRRLEEIARAAGEAFARIVRMRR